MAHTVSSVWGPLGSQLFLNPSHPQGLRAPKAWSAYLFDETCGSQHPTDCAHHVVSKGLCWREKTARSHRSNGRMLKEKNKSWHETNNVKTCQNPTPVSRSQMRRDAGWLPDCKPTWFWAATARHCGTYFVEASEEMHVGPHLLQWRVRTDGYLLWFPAPSLLLQAALLHVTKRSKKHQIDPSTVESKDWRTHWTHREMSRSDQSHHKHTMTNH